MTAQVALSEKGRSDVELAADIARLDRRAVRLLMQRNDRRLFQAALRILKNREDAEDAVQSAYLKAFTAIKGFEGRSSLSTWLTRIVINDALALSRSVSRRRSKLEDSEIPILDEYRETLMRGSMSISPERAVAHSQIRQLLDDAIALLSAPFRTVFVMREIKELTVCEVSERLGIPEATVKTRHLRARRRLQRILGPNVRGTLSDKFPFGASPHPRWEPPIATSCGELSAQAATR